MMLSLTATRLPLSLPVDAPLTGKLKGKRVAELAGRRALDRRLAVPRVVPVLLRAGPVARRARVPDRGNLVRHRVDRVVGRDVPGEELTEGFGIGAAQ